MSLSGDDKRKRAFGALVDELAAFSTDELEAFKFCARRVNRARAVHGDFTAATDDRHFGKEAAEEIADFIAYVGLQLVAREARRQERIECFAHDAIVPALEEAARVAVEQIE